MRLPVFLSILTLLSTQTALASDVLLPSGTSSPNLGLVPRSDNAAPADPLPQSKPVAPTPTGDDIAADLQARVNALKAQSDTSINNPAIDLDQLQKSLAGLPQIPSTANIVQPAYPGTEAPTTFDPAIGLQIPTQIITQPDLSGLDMYAGGSAPPYTLSIDVGDKSVFGPNDIQGISQKLGIPANKISQQCGLTITGIMQSDKGGAIVQGGVSPHATVRYDGNLQGMLLSAQAVCLVDKLPLYAGYVSKIGNRFVAPLQGVNCVPPQGHPHSMVVQYQGDGASQCFYN